jgi:hypothetical protein
MLTTLQPDHTEDVPFTTKNNTNGIYWGHTERSVIGRFKCRIDFLIMSNYLVNWIH